jgi:hypothetical protein
MTEQSQCQHPGCPNKGKIRSMMDDLRRRMINVLLCDECCDSVRSEKGAPQWFRELLEHMASVG